MAGVIGIAVVLVIWRFLIIFGTTVFETVGLSRTAAGFESRSALVGAGYTTAQSELVVDNPTSRRVAAMLVVTGYFGPTTLLALLGVSFVAPTDDDLFDRAIVLVCLLAGIFVLERFGVFRAIGAGPARALARRMVDTSTLEALIVVGDRMVASLVVPPDRDSARSVVDALSAGDVTVLAVDPTGAEPPWFPDGSREFRSEPGDRLVVFGPRPSVESLASG